MSSALPLLPTTVVGSYALPSWVFAADDWIQRGLYGPIDTEETFNDAVDRAIQDQEIAGIDIISDGEMRRRGFVQSFVHKISGLKNIGAPRKVGESGIDQEPVYETTGVVTVGNGMGIVEEFEYLRDHTKKATKVAVPGAFAITAWYKPVEHYKDRTELAWAFVPALKDEIKRLAAAGAKFIQVDEPTIPGYGADHHTSKDLIDAFNECIKGVTGVKFGMHVCFGSHKKIAYAKRSYRPHFPELLKPRPTSSCWNMPTAKCPRSSLEGMGRRSRPGRRRGRRSQPLYRNAGGRGRAHQRMLEIRSGRAALSEPRLWHAPCHPLSRIPETEIAGRGRAHRPA